EVRARRLERGVEGGEVEINGQIQGRFQKVKGPRSGEGDPVHVGSVIEQKLLGRKGTHAVRDDHDGDVRVVCLCSSDRQTEVIDQCRPPVGPKVAGFVGGGQGGAVAAVVVAIHRVPRRGQGLGDMVVSAQV